MQDEEKNPQTEGQDPEEAPEAESAAPETKAEPAPAEDTEEAAEPAAAAEQPAEAAAEPAAAASEPAEAVPALSPKQRRKQSRAQASGPAAPQRSPEELSAERSASRARKAAERSRWRARRKEKRAPNGSAREVAAVTSDAAEEAPAGKRKVRQGVVVSGKGDKTITVRIDRVGRHRVYGKVIRATSTLHAHDERNEAGEGDLVRVVECRPLSRMKRWRLVEILEKAR
jgi:small subunit ribosomal protein S17